MIDKVDVRVSDFVSYGPALAILMEGQAEKHPMPPFRSAKHYKYSADLTDCGIEAIVHLNCRFGRHTHKVEILRAGSKSIWEMADILQALFNVDPFSLELMRVDFAADIKDVPVSWFRDNAYVSRKRFSSQIEKSREHELQFVGMSNATAETIYAGKRPVLIRIYDKLGEWRVQFRRLECDCQRFNARMEGMDLSPEDKYYGMRIPPNWEEYCAGKGYVYSEGDILTRIECQVGGTKRLPQGVRTFGDLRHADDIEPFKGLRVTASKPILNVDAPPKRSSIRNWLAALGWETLQQAHGSCQAARSIVVKHGKGNDARILESLARSAPSSRPPVTLEEIQHVYRVSTQKQTLQPPQRTLDVPYTYDVFQPISHPMTSSEANKCAIQQ